MKKTIFAIALAAVMLITTSGYDMSRVGVAPGDFAPRLSLTNDSQSITLDQFRGQYVVLTFWSANDADSRVKCNEIGAWASANVDKGVAHLSVNLDDNAALAAEIAKIDDMDARVQFNVHGQEAKKIAEDFRLADGVNSLLIGPDGRISEINPTVSRLSSL